MSIKNAKTPAPWGQRFLFRVLRWERHQLFPILELAPGERRGDNSWWLKIISQMARQQLKSYSCPCGNRGWVKLAECQCRFVCLCVSAFDMWLSICTLELQSYFCRAAAVRFAVSDVRGQITTHRDGAAGCSIFAIAQWWLERNYLPTLWFPLLRSWNKCCKHQTTGLWACAYSTAESLICIQLYVVVFHWYVHWTPLTCDSAHVCLWTSVFKGSKAE